MRHFLELTAIIQSFIHIRSACRPTCWNQFVCYNVCPPGCHLSVCLSVWLSVWPFWYPYFSSPQAFTFKVYRLHNHAGIEADLAMATMAFIWAIHLDWKDGETRNKSSWLKLSCLLFSWNIPQVTPRSCVFSLCSTACAETSKAQQRQEN